MLPSINQLIHVFIKHDTTYFVYLQVHFNISFNQL